MIKILTKNPVEVEAIQWNQLNADELSEWMGYKVIPDLESETAYVAGKGPPIYSISIRTREGEMKAMPGDWIIKEPFSTEDRKFYPVKDDIKKLTFTEEGDQLVTPCKRCNDDFILSNGHVCNCRASVLTHQSGGVVMGFSVIAKYKNKMSLPLTENGEPLIFEERSRADAAVHVLKEEIRVLNK